MKNISALLLALTVGASAFAQDATPAAQDTKANCPSCAKVHDYSFKSKNGHEVLPQKCDWAIAISATGFFNYFGNMFNNSATIVAPTFNTANTPSAFAIGNPNLGGGALLVKYMAKGDLAYRVRFQLNAGSTEYRNSVAQSTLTFDPLNPHFVTDKQNNSAYVGMLGLGFEKRRGSSRVQGIFGAELLLGLSGAKTTNTYGNPITVDFNAPVTTTDFLTGSSGPVSDRIKESKTGTQFLGGVRAFAGAEYFIAPKFSIGGEIGFTLGFSTNGDGTTTHETWNSATQSVVTYNTSGFNNNGLRSWGIGLDNANAAINLNFYF